MNIQGFLVMYKDLSNTALIVVVVISCLTFQFYNDREEYLPFKPAPTPGKESLAPELRRYERTSYCYCMAIWGEVGIETGVLGNIIDGDPALEYSNECECESGGVWQNAVSHASTNR